MQYRILTSHVRDEGLRKSLLVSIGGHVFLFLLMGVATYLLPRGPVIDIGSGPGGGQGNEIIRVGLSAEIENGGLGTFKPMLTSRPAAVEPPPEPAEPELEPETPDRETFVEKPPEKKAPVRDDPRRPEPKPTPMKAEPGDVARKPDPGSGGRGRVETGRGAGMGSGVGIEIGSGREDEGRIDSYYVRLVEQRVGLNWLETSLGELPRPVQTIITFEVSRRGEISNIRIAQSSGIQSVDVAARRAVVASTPLPPPPIEFRGRTVRFRAEFNYPPG